LGDCFGLQVVRLERLDGRRFRDRIESHARIDGKSRLERRLETGGRLRLFRRKAVLRRFDKFLRRGLGGIDPAFFVSASVIS